MSENVVAIVEEVIDNGKGKGSGIRCNGLKYGVYDPADAGMEQVAVGTTVSFRFKEAEKGGTVYKNIQGKITPVKDGSALTEAPKLGASVGGGAKRGYRANGEAGGFPIHAEAYERALDRRNAINAAVSLMVNAGDSWSSTDEVADEVIAIARKFEAYTTGTSEITLSAGLDDLVMSVDD